MTLTLEVVGPEAEKLGAGDRKVFQAAGGTIGRLPNNAWVLPDPYVSSRHAVIRCEGGAFSIEDTSTNGVFINSPDNRLVPGQPHTLKSGDWIFIEPYEIRAVIAGGAEDAAPARPADWSDPFAPEAAFPSALQPGIEAIPAEDRDPLQLLGIDVKRTPAPSGPTAADLARSSVLSEHYEAPRSAPAAPPMAGASQSLIPDDYDPLFGDVPRQEQPRVQPSRERPRPPEPAPKPPARSDRDRQPPAAVPGRASAGGDLDAVLAGAGLHGVPVTPDLARGFGAILRIVVAGVMDILQARQRIKNEFRMQVTHFSSSGNNPLKFSANVDDALHNLLVKRNAAYLEPVAAFEDAFNDLRNHQVATLAGVRVAFEAMLAEFDPDRLQERFNKQLKTGALLSAPAKLRYWDMYRERFHEMVRDPETSFRELFGEEFANAYEEQLTRLEDDSRARTR
jgi:type VI secretion system FHA domain protein